MRLYIALCTLWLAGFASGDDAKEYKIVCYYASWASYRVGNGQFNTSNIDPTLCTHIIYTFVGITASGEVEVLDPWIDLPDDGGKDGFANFVALKKLSPDTKFMVAIGGWTQGSVAYSNVVGNSTLRSTFVESIVNFTITHKFDGFDLDWEYPAHRNGSKHDVKNFVLLLKELRPCFDENNLILSAAVAASESIAEVAYDIPGISEYLDFINLMTYEYHATTELTTGHNTPLYPAERESVEDQQNLNIDASVEYWLSEGAPPEKLILGLAFYGKSYTLKDSSQHEPGSLSAGAGEAGEYTQAAGVLAYYEICDRVVNQNWTRCWDEEQLVPYAYRSDQWVTYDDVESILEKINYIKRKGLGGAMIWAIDYDDFRGTCGQINPLLKTINAAFYGECTGW